MSDKPESQPDQRPQQNPKRALSFDEVMAQVDRPAAKAPAARKEEPRKGAQPSFEDILASAANQPEKFAPPPAAPERRSKGRKGEERRMPIVVRKPSLGSAPPPSENKPAEVAPGNGEAEPRREVRPPRPVMPIPESAYAQPSPEETGDFAALLEEAQQKQKPEKLRPGMKVAARIAHLGAEVAFLDLGGKGEGIIDLRELRNDKGELLVHAGETIDGYVLSLIEGNVVVTRSVPKGAGRDIVQQAMDSKVPIEGLVTGQNKGGLEVDLGGMRGFCPSSQIDIRFVDDPAQFVGQRLKFRVMELRGGNAILSRRALLEEERAVKAAELRSRLEVGAQLEGTVTSVRDFGAFVDLGGLEGLVHVSELSHARVAHAQDVVKAGQRIRVQVLRIEKDEKGTERIALSARALEQDPWDTARPQLAEGKKLQGRVARLQPFGAFVELFPGVDGLVHVSALSDRHVQHPREVVKEGETIWVQVESVDDAQKRVALRRISEEEAQRSEPVRPAEKAATGAKRPRVGDVVEATVDKVEPFGVFVHWEGGKGLVPNPELGTPRGSDNKKTTPVGTKFKAQIIEIDERGRYRLSRVAAERASDRADYVEYQRQTKRMAPGKGFGTLGDLLRAKLQEQEQVDED